MKSINFKWLAIGLCLPFLMAGCDWKELPEYEEAEITAVQFYYRWESNQKDPVTGDPVIKEKRMETESDVNSEAATVQARVTVPEAEGSFTETVRSAVSEKKLWGQVSLSTAARLKPLEGTAALGTPDDWSKEHKFEVEAADGTRKIWTIKVVELKK